MSGNVRWIKDKVRAHSLHMYLMVTVAIGNL